MEMRNPRRAAGNEIGGHSLPERPEAMSGRADLDGAAVGRAFALQQHLEIA